MRHGRHTTESRSASPHGSRLRVPLRAMESLPAAGRVEDLRELVRSGDLQLIVPAVGWLFVRTPALKGGRMPEPVALEMVVLHLADALDPQRLPRQILAGAPTAVAAR